MFYLYQGLYDFIQSRPGIREFHSTILRFIVLIHSTFFRERHTFMDGTKMTYNADRLGISVLQALGKLLSILIRLQEEHTQRQQTSLFDEPLTATLRDELAKWLNGLTAEA